MTFKEKSRKKPNEKPAVKPALYSFTDIVDKTCEDLKDCQVKYTIRRLLEMKENLNVLEQELNEFLQCKESKS